MAEINCSNCNRKKCPQRLEGALCSLNEELSLAIKTYESRDPVLVSKKLLEIVVSEGERYKKAVDNEGIGEMQEVTYIMDDGSEKTVRKKAGPNPAVTALAKEMIKSSKIIYEMINPPKIAPMFQQNNQYNFGNGIVREINSLPEEERGDVIKFIDERLNNAQR